MNNWDAMAERLAAANVASRQTFLGVARLAYLELNVECEATAGLNTSFLRSRASQI